MTRRPLPLCKATHQNQSILSHTLCTMLQHPSFWSSIDLVEVKNVWQTHHESHAPLLTGVKFINKNLRGIRSIGSGGALIHHVLTIGSSKCETRLSIPPDKNPRARSQAVTPEFKRRGILSNIFLVDPVPENIGIQHSCFSQHRTSPLLAYIDSSKYFQNFS